ncbi:hypothetical protein ACA910_010594 [Epithemia clementina (nom. ined.)]
MVKVRRLSLVWSSWVLFIFHGIPSKRHRFGYLHTGGGASSSSSSSTSVLIFASAASSSSSSSSPPSPTATNPGSRPYSSSNNGEWGTGYFQPLSNDNPNDEYEEHNDDNDDDSELSSSFQAWEEDRPFSWDAVEQASKHDPSNTPPLSWRGSADSTIQRDFPRQQQRRPTTTFRTSTSTTSASTNDSSNRPIPPAATRRPVPGSASRTTATTTQLQRPPPPQQPPPPPPPSLSSSATAASSTTAKQFPQGSLNLDDTLTNAVDNMEPYDEGDLLVEQDEWTRLTHQKRPYNTKDNTNSMDYAHPITYPFRSKEDNTASSNGIKRSDKKKSSWFGLPSFGGQSKTQQGQQEKYDKNDDDWLNIRQSSSPSEQRQQPGGPPPRPDRPWVDPAVGKLPPLPTTRRRPQDRGDPRRRTRVDAGVEDDDNNEADLEQSATGRRRPPPTRRRRLDPVARYMSQSRWHRCNVYLWSACLGAAMGGYVGKSLLNQWHAAAMVGALVFAITSIWTTSRPQNIYGTWIRAAGLACWWTVQRSRRIRRNEYPTSTYLAALLGLRARQPFPPNTENPWSYRPKTEADVEFDMASSLACLAMVGCLVGGSLATSTPLLPSWMGALAGAGSLAVLTTRRDARGDLCRVAGMRVRRTLGVAWTVCTEEVHLPHHTGIVLREIVDKLLILDRQHRLRHRLTALATQIIHLIQRLVRQQQQQQQGESKEQPPPSARKRGREGGPMWENRDGLFGDKDPFEQDDDDDRAFDRRPSPRRRPPIPNDDEGVFDGPPRTRRPPPPQRKTMDDDDKEAEEQQQQRRRQQPPPRRPPTSR